MLNSFVVCINEQMQRKGFGKARADEVVARFTGLAQHYRVMGHADPELAAMTQAFQELHDGIAEKAKRNMATLIKYSEMKDRFENPASRNTAVFGKTNESLGADQIAKSFVEHDKRSGGFSYNTDREIVEKELWAIGKDVLEHVNKGLMGVQRGKAHLPNIVRELYGTDTKDVAAREAAVAWHKMSDEGVDLFNLAGGSMKKLADWRLPQGVSMAKLVKATEADWIGKQKQWLDWSRMRWPDGSPIRVDQQDDLLKEVFETLSTGGVSKIDPGKFRGNGRAIGNALEQHRFLYYKDADSWIANHEAFGDGSIFDVMVAHVSNMSHQIALIRTFGPNPRQGADTIRALALAAAAKKGGAEVARVEGKLHREFDPMREVIFRENAMDPNSKLANLVTGTANVLISSMLGSAALLQIPGDIITSANVRSLNKMAKFTGMGDYLKSIASDGKFVREISAQSGFVMDEVISATYAMTRFSGLATYGPSVTRRFADVVLRLSLMSRTTNFLRWANQAETMGMLHRSAGQTFAKHPLREVMLRYGITEQDWNEFRVIAPWSPAGRPDVKFLRPIDAKTAGKHELFRKFQGMIFEEARTMVPESTIEGAVKLKGATRPDTLPGAILHSWGMFKNFPTSFYLIYGRAAMAEGSRGGRLKFVGGLTASMMLGAALGMQLRELSQGRDPLPMDTPKFWGKAFLASGGAAIWGDFLFAGVNQFGAGPEEYLAGPIAGFVGDTTNLLLGSVPGDVFQWASTLGTLNEAGTMKTPAKSVAYARRYAPGSSLWWARLALQRQFFDRLEELADPKVYQKRRRRATRRKRVYGNESYWPEGSRTPERAPDFEGALGQ